MVAWNRKTYGKLMLIVLISILFFHKSITCEAGEAGQVTVVDDGSLLTESEVEELKDRAEALAGRSGWNIIIATCEDAEGKSAQTVCEDYFNAYTAGDDGISCLIDMDNREIYIATAGEAIAYLTDARIDRLLDDAYGEITEYAYEECFFRMLEGAESAYEQGIPENSVIYNQDTGERIINRKITGMEALVSLAAAIAAGVALFLGIVGKYRLKWGTYRYDFHKSGSLELTAERDHFVNQVVTHRHIPKNTGSGTSGGSHTSTTHTGSGGRSFGGGGRKF